MNRPLARWSKAIFFALLSLGLSSCIPISSVFTPRPPLVLCGSLGRACCTPPTGSAAASFPGPLVSCDDGLGCDLGTKKCVQPCGAAGQVCCDGPQTRATKWTADGKFVYSPNGRDMVEMCSSGACETATHRCFTCGGKDGDACCPPDAEQATARCVGRKLHCDFQNGGLSGVCRACGSVGRPPCVDGCDPNLKIRNGLCDVCGADLQLPCDAGCNAGLGKAGGVCRKCGAALEIACDDGCTIGTKPVNGICTPCGANGQAACDQGCNFGLTPINGLCRPCGASGQPPCVKACNYPLKVVNGVCRACGARGQVPCDIGCDQPLVAINGVCVPRQGPSSPPCAGFNESCVPPTQSGTHCCQQAGAPLSCVFEKCVACVPHGAVCQLHGTQVCCSYQDSCVINPFSGDAVCDIPDGPK
jgi:hypothetical protein